LAAEHSREVAQLHQKLDEALQRRPLAGHNASGLSSENYDDSSGPQAAVKVGNVETLKPQHLDNGEITVSKKLESLLDDLEQRIAKEESSLQPQTLTLPGVVPHTKGVEEGTVVPHEHWEQGQMDGGECEDESGECEDTVPELVPVEKGSFSPSSPTSRERISSLPRSLTLAAEKKPKAKTLQGKVLAAATRFKEKDPLSERSYRLTEEEAQKRWLWRFMHSAEVRIFCSMAILTNCVFIGISTEHMLTCEIQGTEVGLEWHHVQNAYVFWFALELLLRLLAERSLFVNGGDWKWNLLDTILVICSLGDLIANGLSGGAASNLSMARLLRIFRFMRILRIIRVMRFFQSFRVMVFSIIHSMSSLFWVFVVILFVEYCFGIFFLHGAVEYFALPESSRSDESETDMKNYFGSIAEVLLTLFMCITGGVDWTEVLKPLMAIHWAYGVVFILYVFFMMFGVLNVVIGAFVKTTAHIYKCDRQVIIEDELGQLNDYTAKIKEFFHEADKDSSGTLSWEEFENYLQDDKVKAYFQTLELDVSQAHVLFTLLDTDESNEVAIDEFVDGCLRLKGQARSIDVNMLLYEIEKMIGKVNSFSNAVSESFRRIERRLGVRYVKGQERADLGVVQNTVPSEQGLRRSDSVEFKEPAHQTQNLAPPNRLSAGMDAVTVMLSQ